MSKEPAPGKIPLNSYMANSQNFARQSKFLQIAFEHHARSMLWNKSTYLTESEWDAKVEYVGKTSPADLEVEVKKSKEFPVAPVAKKDEKSEPNK